MKHLINIPLYFIAICYSFTSIGQDFHFSQFSAAPTVLNPGTTGAFDGKQRVVVNYKDQWRSITNPYTTFAGSFDMAIMRDKITNGSIGVGVSFFSDKAGDLDFSTNSFLFSIAANKSIDDKNNFSLGIQGGLAQRGIVGDASKQQWGNQYVSGYGYDQNTTTGEDALMENFIYGDFSAGLYWRFTGSKMKHHAGISAFHLNMPSQSFYKESDKLNARLLFHGGSEFMIGESKIGLLPQYLFMKQGPQIENNAGMLVKYVLDENPTKGGYIAETAVFIGGWHRFGDAAIAMARVDHRNISVGISYDFNLSSLKQVSSGQGGIEISLTTIFPLPPPKRKVKRSLM